MALVDGYKAKRAVNLASVYQSGASLGVGQRLHNVFLGGFFVEVNRSAVGGSGLG